MHGFNDIQQFTQKSLPLKKINDLNCYGGERERTIFGCRGERRLLNYRCQQRSLADILTLKNPDSIPKIFTGRELK